MAASKWWTISIALVLVSLSASSAVAACFGRRKRMLGLDEKLRQLEEALQAALSNCAAERKGRIRAQQLSIVQKMADPAWKYGVDSTPTVGGQKKHYKYVLCNFCNKEFKGGISRFKHHLAGTRQNAAPCTKVPDSVKQEMLSLLNLANQTKNVNKRNREELIDSGAYFKNVNTVAGEPCAGNNSERGVRGPMDRFVVDIDPDSSDVVREKPITEREARDKVCLDIGRCFIENGIPFNVASSPSFISMCRAIGNFGRGFKPPTPYELSHWILDEEVKTTQKIVDEVKKTWTQTGVSILSDGWKDMRGRQLINFLVNNPYGTIFLKSVDASRHVKDADMLCNLFDEVVEEVGEGIVTQLVTDNAANCKAAGNLLCEKRKGLWWTPCAAHCIDLMLEDIGKLPQHKTALTKAKKVCQYIYNHGWALMRQFTKRDLVRPAATRFGTAYLTLESMLDVREALEEMCVSKEWNAHHMSKKAEAKSVKQILLRDKYFWPGVTYAIQTTKPLFMVLRIADSEKVPGMGFIYGCMDRAKEEIAANVGGEYQSYSEIWKIIDARWELQLHQDLHAAAYYLNPRYQYDPNMSTHPEVKVGLFKCVAKLFPDSQIQAKIHLQMDEFRLKRGFFGHEAAQRTIHKRSPVDWWTQYGDETPELTACALRILSLTCSSCACERNWSTFNQIHTKKRNRLHTDNLNKMVFVMYNKRLKSKWMKKASLKDDEDPLVIDEIPSDDEWVVDKADMVTEGDVRAKGHEVRIESDSVQGSSLGEPSKKRRLAKGKSKYQLVDEDENDEANDVVFSDPIRDDFFINSEEEDVEMDEGNTSFDPNFKPLATEELFFNSLI